MMRALTLAANFPPQSGTHGHTRHHLLSQAHTLRPAPIIALNLPPLNTKGFIRPDVMKLQ